MSLRGLRPNALRFIKVSSIVLAVLLLVIWLMAGAGDALAESLPFDGQETGTRPGQVQENSPPRFSKFRYDLSDYETGAGQPFGDPITATDPDGDSVYYALTNGDLDIFTIDSSTGQLRTKVPLDFENPPKDDFWLHVSVRDSKGPDGSRDLVADDLGLIVITVLDADEPGTVTLNWPRPWVGTNLTATLTDPDGGPTGTPTWQWMRSDSRNSGYANITTNGTSNTYTPVAEDEGKYLRVTVNYNDQVGSGGDTAQFTFADQVTELTSAQRNVTPSFSEGSSATRTIPENTPAGVNIGGPVTATGGVIRYTLGGTDGDSLAIVATSGQLQTNASLNHEADDSYTVTVTATNTANATATITVTINVTDEPVEIDGPSSIDFSEGDYIYSSVVAEYTIEPSGATLTLTGPDAGHFSIAQGQYLNFNAQPDYEAPRDSGRNNVYDVAINAVDGTDRATKNVRVRVTNYNEGPVITGPDQVTYVEHTTGVVGRYTARDPENEPIRWTVQDTDDWTYFQISRWGVLTFVEPPDHETKSSYEVVILAQSGMNQATDGNRIAVTVTNADNDPPVFVERHPRTRSVPENTDPGTDIPGPVTASDTSGQQPPPTISYSLVGTHASSFDVDSATGQLRTKAALDYERKNSYTVTVRASIDSSRYSDAVVTIIVTNVDEEGVVGFSSNRARARSSLTATLSDPDGGVTGESWQWAKSATKDGAYTDISGAKSKAYTPDEADVDMFLRAKVSYSDNAGSGQNAQGDSSNAVRDGPNRPPVFPDTGQTRTVPENTAAGTIIGAPVAATDPDNDPLTYHLGGRDAASFAIVSTSGQLQTKAALDYETKNSYTVAVMAADGNGGTGAITVTINVANADDAGKIIFSSAQPDAYTGLVATLVDDDIVQSTQSWQWEISGATTPGPP